MRTMMIANTSVANGLPTAKGALGLRDALGNAIDMTSGTIGSPANADRNGMLQFVNSLGNGSVKTFTINPNDFSFTTQESGYTAEVAPKYTILLPTGNVRTDSFGMQFVGGIVVKKLDVDKNVYVTKYIKAVEVIGTNGVVAAADAITAFKAAMVLLTGDGSAVLPIKSVSGTTTLTYLLNDTTWFVELTGDLRWFNLVKTEGMSYVNTGADAVKFEKELMSNSGGNNTLDKFEGAFADSNFIADSTVNYDIITITTRATAQRPLLPNAAGFDKQLHIYVLHSAKAAIYDKLVVYLAALKASNGAAIEVVV